MVRRRQRPFRFSVGIRGILSRPLARNRLCRILRGVVQHGDMGVEAGRVRLSTIDGQIWTMLIDENAVISDSEAESVEEIMQRRGLPGERDSTTSHFRVALQPHSRRQGPAFCDVRRRHLRRVHVLGTIGIAVFSLGAISVTARQKLWSGEKAREQDRPLRIRRNTVNLASA